MDKKGSGLIIGVIVIALIVVGGVLVFTFTRGNSGNNGQPGVNTGTSSSGQESGSSGGGDFSWCTGNYKLFTGAGYEFKGVTTYKGQKACHAVLDFQGGTQEYYVLSEDGKDFWQIVDYPGYSASLHMVNGQCVAGDCP